MIVDDQKYINGRRNRKSMIVDNLRDIQNPIYKILCFVKTKSMKMPKFLNIKNIKNVGLGTHFLWIL